MPLVQFNICIYHCLLGIAKYVTERGILLILWQFWKYSVIFMSLENVFIIRKKYSFSADLAQSVRFSEI